MAYPAQIDGVWLATDERGALAAMITAGAGPVPNAVLSGPIDIIEIENMLLGLPKIGSARMLMRVGDPPSFIAAAPEWSVQAPHRSTIPRELLHEVVQRSEATINL